MSSDISPNPEAASSLPQDPVSSNALFSELPQPEAIYTTFTTRDKYLITSLLGLSTITSPLTATIYFPLLPLLRSHYDTSSQAVNLTITIYIIFQALSPLFFATISDTVGRRPIYLLTLTLYILANLGLALEQRSYAALLVLRAVQSLGASAAFAVSYGIVADICVPSERGKILGPVSASQNLGTCIGPIVGGCVAWKSGGYVWVFWFLFIVGVVLLVAVGGLLPETARNVVDNGRVQDKRWCGRPWLHPLLLWVRRVTVTKGQADQNQNSDIEGSHTLHNRNYPIAGKRTLNLLDPLESLRIIFWKDSALILWMHGWFYLVDYCIQTTIPSTYKDVYHFNELQIGLSFLPRGAGIILGGYTNGKLMDRNYRVTAAQIGHTINSRAGDNINNFPIERARTRNSWYLFGLLSFVLIGYGWSIQKHSHVSVPLILQFVQGFLGTCLYTIFSTLLVDVFPESPSTAAAAASITRCALAASGVAGLQPLLDKLGIGWYFTFLGLVSIAIGSAVVWAIQKWAMEWRGQRRLKTNEPLNNDAPGEKVLESRATGSPKSTRKPVFRT